MPQTNADRWPTQVLVEAGQILRTLTPSRLATLLLVMDNTPYTQTDMADTIGCSRSSISMYHQTLADLPLPLIEKRQTRYRATAAGEKIVSYINDVANNFDIDLHSINWGDEDDKKRVADCLAPLHNTRDSVPFFILDSLRERSGEIRLGPPLPVELVDIVDDVNDRQQERGENSSRTQVRRRLQNRFAPTDTIEFDEEEIVLEEKGQDHAQLLDQIAQLLFDELDANVDESESSPSAKAQSHRDQAHTRFNPQSSLTHSNQITHQHNPRQFLGGQTSIAEPDTDATDEHERPSVIPVYCISPGNDTGNQHSQSRPVPILPVTVQTLNELADHVSRLIDEYPADTQIEPYLAVQMGSELYPVSPAQLSFDELNSNNN